MQESDLGIVLILYEILLSGSEVCLVKNQERKEWFL